MNVTNIDWVIAAVFIVFLMMGGGICARFIKNVADWTVGGRKMRVFLGLGTGSAEGVGLISLAMGTELGFTKGFSYLVLTILFMTVVPIVYGCTGFVIKRYREAKVVTVPEYAQRRYSKGVRVATGFALSVAGVLNVAIFPIIASQFLTYFLGVPEGATILGFPFIPALMTILIAIALFFAYVGGMVSLIVTNFIQYVIIAFVIIVVTWFVVADVGIMTFHETVNTNMGEAGYNLFKAGSFGAIYFIWIILQQILGFPAFAPNMQKIASTDNSGTARWMTSLSMIFNTSRQPFLLLWGIAALAVMGSQVPEGMDAGLYPKIAGAIYLGNVIPPVLFGVVVAAMLAAFISTVDSYILTWSTVIVNDIICPFVPRKVSERAHLWLLRMMVAAIAIFIFIFGIAYKPAQSLLDYIFLTGTMMLGAGILMIGGFYWKRASTAGAYAAVVFCFAIPVANIVINYFSGEGNSIPAQYFGLGAIISAILVFVIFSLLIPSRNKGNKVQEGVAL